MKKILLLITLCFACTARASGPAPLAYVGYQYGGLTVIDWQTGKIVAYIPLKQDNRILVPAPDGMRLYDLANPNFGTLDVICTITNRVIGEIPQLQHLSAEGAIWDMAITPDGRFVYVTNGGLSNTLDVYDTRTLKDVATVAFSDPSGVRISPDGKTAYVTDNPGPSMIDFISTESKQTIAQVNLEMSLGFSNAIAVSPDGSLLYVATGRESVVVISTASQKIVADIPLRNPSDVSFSPDGKFAYIIYQTGSTTVDTVAKIDTATATVIASSAVFPDGLGHIAVSPDGEVLYAPYTDYSRSEGVVAVLDTATMSTINTIDVGANVSPIPVAFLP